MMDPQVVKWCFSLNPNVVIKNHFYDEYLTALTSFIRLWTELYVVYTSLSLLSYRCTDADVFIVGCKSFDFITLVIRLFHLNDMILSL